MNMVKNGFEPKDTQVDQGDTVIFINQDVTDRWPASNIHPTHGIYPEFDPKKPITKGQVWQFKFDKSGVFKFHDHLNPTQNGTIEVKGSISETKKISLPFLSAQILFKKLYFQFFPKALEKDLKSFDSIKGATNNKTLEYWITLIGSEKFMKKLISDSGDGSKIDCHQEAHYAGRKAYQLEGKNVFKKPNYNCHSGFLHGAIEAFIAEIGGGNNLMSDVSNLCNDFKTEFARFECLHGIGHGLTAYEDYNLPEALKLCQKLPDDYQRGSCLGGVFMENIMAASGKGAVKGHSTNWVSDDPYFPCSGIDQDYQIQFQCYQMQTSRMLQLTNYDFNYISEKCQAAPKEMVSICFTSMGRDLAGYVLRDPAKIINHCQIIPQAYFRDCLRGALNVIIDFWGDNLTDQPQGLCKILEGSDKKYCYNWFNIRLKDVFGKNTAKIKEVCGYADDEFKEICAKGTKN